MTGRALALWILAGCILTTSIARAEPTPAEAELATARALFEEGLAREDAKDWVGALSRFRKVAEIRTTPQVVYNIALCLEKTGKIASADKDYARVERETDASGEPAVRELGRLSRERRKAIAKSIPEVVLSGPSDVSIAIDGAAATAGSPIAIDAGTHELVATKNGDVARRSFVVKEGRTTVDVPIPEPSPRGGVPAAAWITGGVAIAGLGVGIVSLILRSSAISDLDAACGPSRDACPEDRRADVDKVGTLTTTANIGAIVAAVFAVTTGAIVIFSSRSPAPGPGRAAALRF